MKKLIFFLSILCAPVAFVNCSQKDRSSFLSVVAKLTNRCRSTRSGGDVFVCECDAQSQLLNHTLASIITKREGSFEYDVGGKYSSKERIERLWSQMGLEAKKSIVNDFEKQIEAYGEERPDVVSTQLSIRRNFKAYWGDRDKGKTIDIVASQLNTMHRIHESVWRKAQGELYDKGSISDPVQVKKK